MAQKAAKTLASRNSATLNRTHLITLSAHALYLILRLLLRFHGISRGSLVKYGLLSAPGLVLEFWLERIGRPSYGPSPSHELRRSGEDLDAKGLTEWMWDVIYWTQGVVVGAAVLGDWVWWLWGVAPVYTVWLAYSTFTGARSSLGGMMGGENDAAATSTSKRQQKLEKRGGQRMQYR